MEVFTMTKAKIFENGGSQAVRLPKKFQFKSDEVVVQKLGDALILIPYDSIWKSFEEGLSDFTEDFFVYGRNQEEQEKREKI